MPDESFSRGVVRMHTGRRRVMKGAAAALAVAILAAAPRPARAQSFSSPAAVTGTFHIIWADGRAGAPAQADRRYVLITDAGRWYDVRLDPGALRALGGERALDRRRVTLDVRRVLSPAEARTAMPVVEASGARVTASVPSLSVGTTASNYIHFTGAQPFVTILCRFQDTDSTTIPPPSRAQTIMGSSYPGMGNYYGELSNGVITLAGSKVVGWYTLPHARAFYIVNGQADLNQLLSDCTGAADADVHFPDFRGINLQFSDNLDCCSWGGSTVLTLDGTSKGYGVTWNALWGLTSANYAHEMGHSFGWPHSHGPYGLTYDSKWDVMSWSALYYDPVYGNVPGHTIAYNKWLVGWIPAARHFVAPVGTSTILVERSAQPEANADYLLAEVPIPGTTERYTIEARRWVGSYDSHLPGQAIIIHQCADACTVIDADGNGDVNDAGAMWTPGETFTDTAHEIAVHVDAQVGNAWQVTISNQVASTTPLTIALSAKASRDTMVAGAMGTLGDSVAVLLSGSGATTTAWTAAHRASWLALAATSGTGSGMLHWSANAQGLSAGTYVDTVSVSASGASGSPARLVVTLVALAQPSVAAAAADLLGGAPLAGPVRRWLDQQGNGNGTYDLGDFLAYQEKSGAQANAALAARPAAARERTP